MCFYGEIMKITLKLFSNPTYLFTFLVTNHVQEGRFSQTDTAQIDKVIIGHS